MLPGMGCRRRSALEGAQRGHIYKIGTGWADVLCGSFENWGQMAGGLEG